MKEPQLRPPDWRCQLVKALKLLRQWPSPDPAFVVAIRLRSQRSAHRALALRVK